MFKKISIELLLLLLTFQTIYTRIITTNDLKDALSQVNPGDTIELKSGKYVFSYNTLKNGTKENKIKIKSAPNADVTFTGSSDRCVFEAESIHDVIFEGPMSIDGALCGFKFKHCYNINITDVRFFDIQQQAIVVSGYNITIYNNKIYGCVLENSYTAKSKISGWKQCVAILGTKEWSSYGVTVENNTISFSYGEALYLVNCHETVVAHNEITNGLSANIYIDSGFEMDIDGNILRVNSTQYDNKYGSACGIAMTSDIGIYGLHNINITNNIILGTRIGINYFITNNRTGYHNVRILHNTLWNVHVTPISFSQPDLKFTSVFGCELKNNFIYFEGAKELAPKKAWELGYNFYYNTVQVPTIYSDDTSKAEKNLELNTVFNQINGCNDYYNQDLKPDCLRPSKQPGKLKLFHSGKPLKPRVQYDKVYCRRNDYTPSIGAFEFPEGCSGGIDPDPTDAPVPYRDYDVRFNITYCTSGYRVMKIVGSFCYWNVGKVEPMTQDKKCNWSYIFKDGTTLEFKYKFVEAIGNSAYKVESDPHREFKGKALAELVRKSPTGKYEDCDYTTSGDIITLVCTWR